MTKQPSPACSGNEEDAVSIEITDEMVEAYLKLRGHETNEYAKYDLTAAATVLASSLDKRPTRSELRDTMEEAFSPFVVSQGDDGYFIAMSTEMQRIGDERPPIREALNAITAAGFVRDDPAPVVPEDDREPLYEIPEWLLVEHRKLVTTVSELKSTVAAIAKATP